MPLAYRFLYHLLCIYTNRQPAIDYYAMYIGGLKRLLSASYEHLLLLQRI